jgi:hypothetical protein
MATYKVHVFINPLEGRDAEFNEWYDAEHVPDVLALPGFVRAERFAVHPLGDESMRYLTVYEVDADNPDEVLERIRAGRPTFRHSDSVDFSTAIIVATSPIGPVAEATAD